MGPRDQLSTALSAEPRGGPQGGPQGGPHPCSFKGTSGQAVVPPHTAREVFVCFALIFNILLPDEPPNQFVFSWNGCGRPSEILPTSVKGFHHITLASKRLRDLDTRWNPAFAGWGMGNQPQAGQGPGTAVSHLCAPTLRPSSLLQNNLLGWVFLVAKARMVL